MVDEEVGNKGADEGEFIGMTERVSSGGDQQDGDVGNGARVADGPKAGDGGLLLLVGDARGQVFAMQQSELFHEWSPLIFVKVYGAEKPTGNGLGPS